MQFDTALNLLWLAFCVLALAGTMRSRRVHSSAARVPWWLHVCGVALISAALFPYISATDDVLRIQHMDVQQTRHDHRDNGGKKGPSDALIRLYETMDTPVVYAVRQISFVLIFVSLVIVPLRKIVSRTTPRESGRGPPFLFA